MKKDTNTIQSHIKILDDVPPRDPNKTYLGRSNFIRQAKIQKTSVTNPANLRLTVWDRITQLKEINRMKIAGILMIVTLLLGGTGASVAAAQSSMPGDLLYPVKIFTEDIQMELTSGDQNQFDLAMKFTQRRYEEIQTILAEEGTPSEEMMATFQNQIKYNLELALEVEEPEEAVTEFQNLLKNQNQNMLQTQHNEEIEPFQFQMQSMMQYHLQMIEEGFENLEMLQEQLQFQYQYKFGETIEPFQNMQQSQNEDGLGDQNKNNASDENGNNGQDNQGPNTSDNGGNGNNGGSDGNGGGDGGSGGGNGGGSGGGGGK